MKARADVPDMLMLCPVVGLAMFASIRSSESGDLKADVELSTMEAANRANENQRAEIGQIVRRLEAIVTTHLEGARRVGNPLTLEQVIAIIDALRAEAEGQQRPVAFSDGEVAFYLMDGLYEELLGEPSNIFSVTPVAGGVVRFEPLQREFWLTCLQALRQRLERLGLALG